MKNLECYECFGTEGSGNQKKIWVDNQLIKLDSKLRESNKEVSAGNFGKSLGLDCVTYTKIKIRYNGAEHNGVICDSYLLPTDNVHNLNSILEYYNINIPANMSSSNYFKLSIECISRFTGLSINYLIQYLGNMLIFDFLIANSDRHLSNIEFIRKQDGTWRGSPYFDFGQSFYGKDAILTGNQLEQYSRKFKSRPFSTNPYKNLCLDKCTLSKLLRQLGGLNHPEYVYNGVMDSHAKVIRHRLNLLKKYINTESR